MRESLKEQQYDKTVWRGHGEGIERKGGLERAWRGREVWRGHGEEGRSEEGMERKGGLERAWRGYREEGRSGEGMERKGGLERAWKGYGEGRSGEQRKLWRGHGEEEGLEREARSVTHVSMSGIPWRACFLSSIFRCTCVKWSTMVPPTHPPTKANCVLGPNSHVVSNVVLPLFSAHKQGLHPLPPTIWASHHPSYPAGHPPPQTQPHT